jgi:hypothetical protein
MHLRLPCIRSVASDSARNVASLNNSTHNPHPASCPSWCIAVNHRRSQRFFRLQKKSFHLQVSSTQKPASAPEIDLETNSHTTSGLARIHPNIHPNIHPYTALACCLAPSSTALPHPSHPCSTSQHPTGSGQSPHK